MDTLDGVTYSSRVAVQKVQHALANRRKEKAPLEVIGALFQFIVLGRVNRSQKPNCLVAYAVFSLYSRFPKSLSR